jgi:prepilin-type N-terminal cleavage/methylation domain-containing protein
MKKQSGFTLIELLLVLAIIGIISAIAIPALLSQRARARDKSATSNADSVVADLVGQYDRYKEIGTNLSTVAGFNGAIMVATNLPQVFNAINPWFGTVGAPNTAYNPAVIAITTIAGPEIVAAALPATLGQVQTGYLPVAAGAASQGAICSAVYLQNSFNSNAGVPTHVYLKAAAIE